MMNDCTCNDQLDAITEQLTRLLRGEKAQAVASAVEMNPALQNLLDTVNRLVTSFNSVQDYIQALAAGDVDVPAPPRNLLASRFKQLQANLLHLTWQTEQIAAGDYTVSGCISWAPFQHPSTP